MKTQQGTQQPPSATKPLYASKPLRDNDTNKFLSTEQLHDLLSIFSQSFSDSVRHFSDRSITVQLDELDQNKHVILLGSPGSGKTHAARNMLSQGLLDADTIPVMLRLDPINIPTGHSRRQTDSHFLKLFFREVCYGLIMMQCSNMKHSRFQALDDAPAVEEGANQEHKYLAELVAFCDAYAHRSKISWRDVLDDFLRPYGDRLHSDIASGAQSFNPKLFDKTRDNDRIKQMLHFKRKRVPEDVAPRAAFSDLGLLLSKLTHKRLLILVDGLELTSQRTHGQRNQIATYILDMVDRIVGSTKGVVVQLVMTMQCESFAQFDQRKVRYFQKIPLDHYWTPQLMQRLFNNLYSQAIGSMSPPSEFLHFLMRRGFDKSIFESSNPRKLMMYISERLEDCLLNIVTDPIVASYNKRKERDTRNAIRNRSAHNVGDHLNLAVSR